MPKKIVKKCVRPQCIKIYNETECNRYCMCGALLQIAEIEDKPKKNTFKKPEIPSKHKYVSEPKLQSIKTSLNVKDDNYISLKESSKPTESVENLEDIDFFKKIDDENLIEESDDGVYSFEDNDDEPESKAFLYLLLGEEEVKFELTSVVKIGRAANGVHADIDLSEYAGKDVSREHVVIQKEKDGYYITNVSRNHSVRIMDQDENEIALEYGKRMRLYSEYGIILSKKILLQFVEEE